ncbi:MAG: hypothetical protein R3Y59_04055 [bacterium]
MRKIITLLMLFFTLFSTVSAQQLTNSTFDTFQSDDLNDIGYRPTGWYAANVNRTVVGVTASASMLSYESGRTGNCVRMESEWVGAAGIGSNSPMWISLGQPWNYVSGLSTSGATAGTDGGLAFTYRPDTLAVWIKRDYSTQEDANIVVYSWSGTSKGSSYMALGGSCTSTGDHYDEESDIRLAYDANVCGTSVTATQISEGSWRSSAKYTDWTEIKVPIAYLTNDVPDKINVIISASNYPNFRSKNVESGSILYVDDLSLIYSSKVHDLLLDNRSMSGFSQDQYTYNYELGATATKVPTITLKRSGRLLSSSEYTISYGAIGEATTITVKAEDGSSTTTYTVNFAAQLSTNPRPADILIDGESVANFNNYVYTYNVELPYGTTEIPTITIDPAESGQTYTVTAPTSLPGSAVVTVIAEDGTTSQSYTINFTLASLTDNTLTDISVNGITVTGFASTTNNYTVELPVGTVDDPIVTYTTAYPDEHTIVVDNQGLSGGVTISVTPTGTTLTRVYRLTFVITASTYSYLQSITVDGVELEGFDPTTLTYSVALPVGTAELPAIAWEQGDAYQTVTAEYGGTDGTTRITVVSQSGAISIYRITFSTEQSSISTLQNIYLDGVALDGFDAATTEYTVSLPIGTTTEPTITWVVGDSYQTVSFILGGLTSSSRIIVKAQDGTTTTYTISYVVEQSSNSTLNSIELDGIELDGFDAYITSYDITLDRGTTTLPTITWVAGDSYQTVRKVEGGVSGTTTITVKSQTGETTIYYLNFSVEVNSNVSLDEILLDGVLLTDFDSDVLDYSYTLPSGTVELPTITYAKGDDAQSVVVTRNGVNGTTTITVRAEDGTTQTYSITFSVERSENAFLQMIYIDGAALEGFDANVLSYTYELAEDATTAPSISVDSYAGQTVSILSPLVSGMAQIIVTPEEGDVNIYTINFHYAQSTLSTLQDIKVDGATITGFAADVYDYYVELPQNTTTLPTVEFTLSDDATQKGYVTTAGVEGETKITVMAEDGTTTIYTIHFSTYKSSNSLLASILVDGVEVDNFDAERLSYDISLAPSDTKLPAITYTLGDANQTVDMSLPALEGAATIAVTSQDGTSTTTYTLNFVVDLSSNAELSNIYFNGVALQHFNGVALQLDKFDENNSATITLEADEAVPTVTYERGDEWQSVAIADAGYNGMEILVVAQDGTTNKYFINYNVLSYTSAKLADVQLSNGLSFASLDGFGADIEEYTYTLAWGTETVPVINPVFGSEGQTVLVEYGAVNDTTFITVTSEDGFTTQHYSIYFPVAISSVSSLSQIYVEGNSYSEFSADVLEYTIDMPYGTTQVPTITWDLGKEFNGETIKQQRVTYSVGNLYTPSTITVLAEDGLSTTTYTINYTVAAPSNSAQLATIFVDGVAVDGFAGETLSYNAELPYGTTALPAITYIKTSETQSVFVKMVGGVDGYAELTVLSNNAEAEEATYIVDFSVSETPTTSFTSVMIDGVEMSRFNPAQYAYIVPVTSTPVITYTYNSSQYNISVLANNTNMYQVEIYNKDDDTDLAIYTFYYHYTSDVIPNADFEDWTTAKYNSGAKPTSWTVPADAANSYSYYWGSILWDTYTTGDEVSKTTYTGNAVKLQTQYNYKSICGAIPAMITLGDMSVSLASGGNSTSSVSGSIDFRNTPDNVYLDYKSVDYNKITGWRLLVTMGDGSTSVTTTYSGDYSNTSSWRSVTQPISYGSLGEIKTMNIVINSADTEDASSLGSLTEYKYSSELHVDNLAFQYSNLLSSITIDGQAISGFSSTTYSYSVARDVDALALPVVEVTGAVDDQEHQITITDEDENRTRVVSIVSVAEDGSVDTYTVNLTREESTNTALGSIYINDVALKGFDAAVYEYNYSVDNLNRFVPSVTAVAASDAQMINFIINDESIAVRVIAENGILAEYIINLVEEKNDEAKLANITLSNHDEMVFDAETNDYAVTLAYGEELPTIEFEKISDGQIVLVNISDTTTLKVTAQDGVATNEYKIIYDYSSLEPSGILTDIKLDYTSLSDFASDKYDYEIDIEEEMLWQFTAGSAADVVSQLFTPSSVAFTVAGVDTATYNIEFITTLSSDASLTTLQLNDVEFSEFSPSLYRYERSLERGEYPYLMARSTDGASLTVDYALTEDDEEQFVYVAQSEDGENEASTVVVFNTAMNSEVALSDILIDGASLQTLTDRYSASAIFDAETLIYDIDLFSETPKMSQPTMPSISYVEGGYGQSVLVEKGDVNSTTYITVTSESGASRIYELNFTTQKSSNTSLSDIAIDFESIENFDAATYNYVVEILAAEELPTVTYQTTDAYQTVEVLESEDTITVTVTAEDKTQATYTISFNRISSSDASLSMIFSDGVAIDGFNADSLEYYIDLPIGTEYIPEISVTAGDDGQTISVVNAGVNGTTTITVVAEDGVTTRSYLIHFTRLLLEDNTLQMITLDGGDLVIETDKYTASSTFDADVRQYTITLPVGSQMPYPIVGWVESHYLQTITSTTDETTGSVIITVTPEDTDFVGTYQVDFVVLKSENDTLSMIVIDDVDLQGFSPSVFDYTVDLPVGTTTVPVIEAEAGDQWQSVDITQADSVNGKAVIEVMAEDTQFSNRYTIQFNRLLSDVKTLNAILLDGTILDGFNSNVYTYDIMLPIGTTQLPIVTIERGDLYQTISVDSAGLTSPYVISVTAENGNEQSYIINFTVEKSHDATLQSILVDGELLAGFDYEIYNYVVQVPYGSVDVPAVSYVASQPDIQTVTLVSAASLSDTTYITVVAEDDTTSIVYKVSFEIIKSSNAQLSAIRVGGELISTQATGFVADNNFDKDDYIYYITFPYGTEVLPEITWDGVVADYESITITGDTVRGQSIITVVSQDRYYVNDYVLNFDVKLSDDAQLKSLNIGDDLLSDFDTNNYAYLIQFPIGTDTLDLPTVDDVVFEKMLDSQTVVVEQSKPTEIVITVTAENGTTVNVYVINFEILLSDNSYLSSILVDGIEIEGFYPTQFDYVYYLYKGATIPTFEGVKAEESQTIEYVISPVGEMSHIYVDAEDGSYSEYRILFTYSNINAGDVPSSNDVAWTDLGNGRYQASTIRNNVTVMIYDSQGLRIMSEAVGIVDANEDLSSSHDGGTILQFSNKNLFYIYVFVYNNQVISSGKFIY